MLTKDGKKIWITNYILENQDCIKQRIIDAADKAGISSRNTTFDLIEELKEENIVREYRTKPNSRSTHLSIDCCNPIINIPKKIRQIRTEFIQLLKEIMDIYDNHLQDLSDVTKSGDLMSKYLGLLQNFINWISECYNRKSTLIWPNQIKDTKSLKDIIGTVVLEIAFMQSEFINNTIQIDKVVKLGSYLHYKPNQSHRTNYFSNDLRDKRLYFGITDEIGNLYNSNVGQSIDSLLNLVWEDNKNNWFDLFIDRDPHSIDWKRNVIEKAGCDPKEISWDMVSTFLNTGFSDD